MDGIYIIDQPISKVDKKPSAQRIDLPKRSPPARLGAWVVTRMKSRSSSTVDTQRENISIEGNKNKPLLYKIEPLTCCKSLWRGGSVKYLNRSIENVKTVVLEGNSRIFKKNSQYYRHAVDHLLDALSRATLADVSERSPERSFSGNLRVDGRYQLLHDLLENECPYLRGTMENKGSYLKVALSDLRECVYFLNQMDQEIIYWELDKKLKEPHTLETIPE